MQRLATTARVALFLLLAPLLAAAQDGSLTLEQALARARERAPGLLSASARIEEARGRLVGASILLRENPIVETAAGNRSSDDDHSFDGEVGVSQRFELGGRRGARIAGAEAQIGRANADRDESLRRLLREVAVSFYRGVAAGERARLAGNAEEIAADVARIAERRYEAEDVPLLDVNVSRTELARARAERRGARAAVASSLGELRLLLGMDAAEAVVLHGDLRDRRRFDLAALLGRAGERADLRTLQAELDAAEAELRLAQGEAWPDFGLGARYERDDRADVVLGELSFSLPVFERGQGLRAEASARARRLRLELEAGRRAAAVEVQTAFDVHAERAAAAEELETNALPLLDQNESLARRSYEVGQIGLAELLLVRHEVLGTRNDYVERLLEAAVAAVDLEASAGALE